MKWWNTSRLLDISFKGGIGVSHPDPHIQIARKLRSMETTRIELIQQVAEVFRGIQTGNQKDLSEALGGLVGMAYFLAVKMGIPFDWIERDLQNGFPKVLMQDFIDLEDFEVVKKYISGNR